MDKAPAIAMKMMEGEREHAGHSTYYAFSEAAQAPNLAAYCRRHRGLALIGCGWNCLVRFHPAIPESRSPKTCRHHRTGHGWARRIGGISLVFTTSGI